MSIETNFVEKEQTSMPNEQNISEKDETLMSRNNIEKNQKNNILEAIEDNEDHSEEEEPVKSKAQKETDIIPFQKNMNYEYLIQILETLQNGFENKDTEKMVELFVDNGIWSNHPHDQKRSYEGKFAIAKMLDKDFSNAQRIVMQYFPDKILFDAQGGKAYVEWILKSKQPKNNGYNIRFVSCAVRLNFTDTRISSLKAYAMKTIDNWTKGFTETKFHNWIENDLQNTTEMKPMTTEMMEEKDQAENSKTRKNNHDNNNNNSSRSPNGKNRNHHQNGGSRKNNRSSKNGNRNGRRNRRSRRRNNGSRGRNNNHGRNNNGRRNNNRGRDGSRNRRDQGRNSRYGRYPRGMQIVKTHYQDNKNEQMENKNETTTWICSVCQELNVIEARECKRCQKEFKFGIDLTTEQKEEYLSISEVEENRPIEYKDDDDDDEDAPEETNEQNFEKNETSL